MNAFSRFFRRIDWPNHLTAFISTLLGVWLAFYLGNLNESRRDHSRMEVAMANVRQEVKNNHSQTVKHIAEMDSLLAAIKGFAHLLDNDLKMILTEKQMASFQKDFAWFMKITGKHPIRDSLFEYDGTLNLNLNFSEISDIAWENTKLMDVLHLIDTETAFQLHSLYRLQGETQKTIGEATDILKNLFQNNNDGDAITRKIVNDLYGQLQFAYIMNKTLEIKYLQLLEQLPE